MRTTPSTFLSRLGYLLLLLSGGTGVWQLCQYVQDHHYYDGNFQTWLPNSSYHFNWFLFACWAFVFSVACTLTQLLRPRYKNHRQWRNAKVNAQKVRGLAFIGLVIGVLAFLSCLFVLGHELNSNGVPAFRFSAWWAQLLGWGFLLYVVLHDYVSQLEINEPRRPVLEHFWDVPNLKTEELTVLAQRCNDEVIRRAFDPQNTLIQQQSLEDVLWSKRNSRIS